MTYLKCSHCGYLNPLTGQYQTFCQNCNKKLENNFSDWHKLHPDKSFEDFKVLFGQTGETVLPQKRSHRESQFFKKDANGKTKVLWGALIGFVIMITIITVAANFGSQIVESFFFDKTSKILLTNPWQTVTPGNSGLTFATPLKLNEFNQELPSQVRGQFEFVKSYSTNKSQPLQIAVTIMKLKPPLKARLQEGANGAVGEMMNQPDVSQFTYNDSQTAISDIPAILQSGSYLWQNTDKIHFRNLVITRERTAWQITILYKADDPSGTEVADSIIHSVTIK